MRIPVYWPTTTSCCAKVSPACSTVPVRRGWPGRERYRTARPGPFGPSGAGDHRHPDAAGARHRGPARGTGDPRGTARRGDGGGEPEAMAPQGSSAVGQGDLQRLTARRDYRTGSCIPGRARQPDWRGGSGEARGTRESSWPGLARYRAEFHLPCQSQVVSARCRSPESLAIQERWSSIGSTAFMRDAASENDTGLPGKRFSKM